MRILCLLLALCCPTLLAQRASAQTADTSAYRVVDSSATVDTTGQTCTWSPRACLAALATVTRVRLERTVTVTVTRTDTLRLPAPTDTAPPPPPDTTTTPPVAGTWGSDVNATAAKLLGPYPGPLSSLSPTAKAHHDRWLLHMNTAWAKYGPQWDAALGNYYDRAYGWMGEAAWRGKLGVASDSFWQRGAAQVVNYRDRYVFANACNVSAHWWQPEGLLLHAIVARDTASRRAILCVLPKFASYSPEKMATESYIYRENRILNRAGKTALYAWVLDPTATSSVIYAGKSVKLNAGALSDSLVMAVIRTQLPNGSWRYRDSQSSDATKRVSFFYMDGMAIEFLLDHQRVRGTIDVMPAVRKHAAYLKATWLPAYQLWPYRSDVPYDPTKPTYDLNLMVSPSLAATCGEGDAASCALWDAAVKAATSKGWFASLGKQLNELGWRFPAWVGYRGTR